MHIAVIPAGGQGRRMLNSCRPKQFLELSGIPILVHTLRQFEACAEIGAVVLVLPATELDLGSQMIRQYNLQKVLPPVAGASERQGSVYCGIRAIENDARLRSKVEICAIHDGVRPFITPQQIAETIFAAKEHRAAICAVAATDTIKRVEDGVITDTIERSSIYLAQTPQSFEFELIAEAHRRAAISGLQATDDAMLVERMGVRVAIVESSTENIKITRPEDLPLAELILKRREGAYAP